MKKDKISNISLYRSRLNDSDLTPQFKGRTELSNLYPKAKTFEDIEEDNNRRQKLYEARRPKLPNLILTITGSLLTICILLFILNIESMWMSGEIAKIFFSFAISIFLFGCIMYYINFANEVLYGNSKSKVLFWNTFSIFTIIGFISTIFLYQHYPVMAVVGIAIASLIYILLAQVVVLKLQK